MWFSSTRRSRVKQARTADRTVDAQSQSLEKRTLLAGNAIVSFSGGNLSVTGDGLDNTIEVTAAGGNVIVRGLNNTTINGSTTAFIAVSNSTAIPGSVSIGTGDGNDTVMFSRNVSVGGLTTVDGGAGNDSIGSTGATFQGGVQIHGRRGNDSISLSNTTVAGLLWIKTKTGDDIVSLDGVTVNGRLKIKSGKGNDNVVLNNVTVSDKTSIHTEANNDIVAVRNSTLNGHVKIRTRQNEDMVVLEGNTFRSTTHINTGRNIDNVLIRQVNTFTGRLSVNGGDGQENRGLNGDAIEVSTTSVTTGGRSFRRHELTTVPPTTVTALVDNATTGVFALADAADKVFSDLLNASSQAMTIDTSENETVTSTGNVLITRDQDFVIKGTAAANATVSVDSDGDGQFDDGSVTADANGAFSVTVGLTRRDLDTSDTDPNDQLNGLQTIRLESFDPVAGVIRSASVRVDFVRHSVVRMISNVGTYEVELFDNLTPNTVSNFLGYSARYTNSIIHRSIPGFIVQGGGFTVAGGRITAVATDAPVNNEFNAATSNIRGTLAMAQPSDINGGTSQWFVNTANNNGSGTTSNLDAVPHTVFGRVIGNGMTVVDQIAAVSRTSLVDVTGISALTDTPVRNPFVALDQNLTGTVSTTANSSLVTGVGTRFTQELHTNLSNPNNSRSRISINGQTFNVASITSDTQLLIQGSGPTTASTNVQARTDSLEDADFVRYTSIAEILDQV